MPNTSGTSVQRPEQENFMCIINKWSFFGSKLILFLTVPLINEPLLSGEMKRALIPDSIRAFRLARETSSINRGGSCKESFAAVLMVTDALSVQQQLLPELLHG
jgi:hypothetical protein